MARDLNRSIKIFIDNSDAMAKASKLEAKITDLRASMQKLAAEGKKNSNKYKAEEKAHNQFVKSLGNYNNKIKETERILKNLSGSTYKELDSTRKMLRAELREETRGTEQYNAKLKALNAVQKEFNIAKKEMNSNVGQGATLMNRAVNSFNKYFGMATAGIAAITGLSFTLRKLSQDAAEMDDVYSDVMKTTNMTKDEVLDLNETFKGMDTRTSREQLNMLARDAGKLGLQSKEDILGFVEAANQIDVALGEDLGEGAVREVGKMVDVFTKSTDELEGLELKEKMLAVGSAINELGASSSAQEDYLVQFAGRLGGVAAQANIGIDAILGYGSVLDQDMQKVEMSATALQQILVKMMGDPAKFAQIAGVEVGKFTELVKTDANEAVKVLLRSLNEKGGFAELIPIFDEMGLSGTRAVGVLSSLASSVDKIDEAQQLANKSMVEATSLTDEYNIKNKNAAAELEKRKKAFKDAAEDLGKRLNPALLKSTNIITYIVKFLPALLDWFGKYGGILFKTTALVIAYNLALRAQTTWTKLALVEKIKLIAANVKEQASLIALNLRYVAGSKNLTELSRSMKALFSLMKLNPWALAITALTAIGILLYENARRTRNLTNSAKAMSDMNKTAAESIARERTELNMLLSTARNEKLSKEQRHKAIKELNEISPEYLGNLKLEDINTQAATTAVENYTTALMNNARQRAIADKVSDLYAKRLEKEADIAEQNERKARAGRGSDIHNIVDRKIGSIEKEIALIDKQIKMYDDLNQTILVNAKNKKTTIATNDDNALPSASPFAPSTASDEAIKKELEAFETAHKQKILALKTQQLEEKLTEEWFAKESVKAQVLYYEQKVTLQKKHGVDTVDTETQQIDFLLNLHKNADDNLLNLLSETRNSMLQSLDAHIELEREKLQDQVDAGTITRHEYNSALISLELDVAQERVDIAEEYEQLIRDEIFETAEARKKALDDAVTDTEKAYNEMYNAEVKANKDKLKEEEQFEKDRKAALTKYNLVSAKDKFNEEKDELDEAFDEHLLSLEEYLKARLKITMDYYAAYAQHAVDIAKGLSDAVSSYHKLEADSLEAEKQRELTAARDNAEKREAISQKYAQKELDLKKKQSAANATIQIAEATSAAALAIANIWSKHGANPILAGILTALSTATTALQIASIIKQRSAIMSTTLTPSSGTSSGTGARVVNQRAKGKYDVIGADDGQHYKGVPYAGLASTGFVSTPTLMGEQGRELVVSAPDLSRLQRHINYPLIISAINDARSGVVPQRAEGNYSQIPQQAQPVASLDPRLIAQLTNAIERLNNQGVLASVSLSELQSKQDLLHKSQKIGRK